MRTCAAGRPARTRSCRPDLSRQLRDRKLDALQTQRPALILSANIGCLAHLQGGTDLPVRHWIEWLDARLKPG